eukprot:6196410-Pleurochrysis_carterae.AAC.6
MTQWPVSEETAHSSSTSVAPALTSTAPDMAVLAPRDRCSICRLETRATMRPQACERNPKAEQPQQTARCQVSRI